MMNNILVTSQGASWPIIPELLGFTNTFSLPLVVSGKMRPSPALKVEPEIKAPDFPVSLSLDQEPSTALYDEITERIRKSENAVISLYRSRIQKEKQSTLTHYIC